MRSLDLSALGIEAKLNYDEAFHPIHRIRIILISCMVSVLVFGIGASYFLARLFTHRVVELNKTAAALAGGDMNARVPERKPWMKDEVYEVGLRANGFLFCVQELFSSNSSK